MQVLAYKLMLNFLNLPLSFLPHSPLFIRSDAEAEVPGFVRSGLSRVGWFGHEALASSSPVRFCFGSELQRAFILNLAAHQSALSFLSTYSSPCPLAATSIIGRSWS